MRLNYEGTLYERDFEPRGDLRLRSTMASLIAFQLKPLDERIRLEAYGDRRAFEIVLTRPQARALSHKLREFLDRETTSW